MTVHRHLSLCLAAALLAACSRGSHRRADSAGAEASPAPTPEEVAAESASAAAIARAREASVPGRRDTLIVSLPHIELRVGDTLDLAKLQVSARGADGTDAGQVPLSFQVADEGTAAIRPLKEGAVLVGVRAGSTELHVTTPVFARGTAGATIVPVEVRP